MDWKRKLTSRKFWVAVCGFVTALLTAFNVGSEAEKITAVIMAFATLIGYVLAEGLVDAAAAQNPQVTDGSTTASQAASGGTAAQSPQPADSTAAAQGGTADQNAATVPAQGGTNKA